MLHNWRGEKTYTRYRRVVAFEPAWTQVGKARATVVIDYRDGQGEGKGTYWVPLSLSGSYRRRRRQAERVAQIVAQGLAEEYALERGIDPKVLRTKNPS
jgi:hypothetical protein